MTPDEKQHMCAVVANVGLASAGLDDEDLEKLWAGKYRTAERLRAATREGLVEARLAPGAVDAIRLASGMRVPTPEAKARERVIATYAVTDIAGQRIFTPLLERILVTYCHGSHAEWHVGQEIQVLVNDGTCDKQRLVKSHVLGIHPHQHVLFCSTTEPINAPYLDISVRAGEPYIILGCSNRSQQARPFSISHGLISTTTPDNSGFIRGDTTSLRGEFGGGCFSAETGMLVAVNVAADVKNGNRAVLLSVSSLMSLLYDHHLDELQKLMPGWMQDSSELIVGE